MAVPNRKPELEIDKGTLAIIELTATRTAEATVLRHKLDCPINAVKADLWGIEGTNNDGIKGIVRANERILREVADRNKWWKALTRQVAAALIVAILTGVATWIAFNHNRAIAQDHTLASPSQTQPASSKRRP